MFGDVKVVEPLDDDADFAKEFLGKKLNKLPKNLQQVIMDECLTGNE